MASSPYLTPELKQYIKDNRIEETLNDLVNQLLKGKFSDPYAFMVKTLELKSSSDITITSLKAFESFNAEGTPIISLIFKCVYRLKDIEIVLNNGVAQILEPTNNLYDFENNDRFLGKGLTKACALINSVFSENLQNLVCQHQKKIDEQLMKIYEEKDKSIGNIIYPISFALPNICSRLYNLPLFKYLKENTDCLKRSNNKSPPIMVNILQGGKICNSKCKFFKYQIILEKEKPALEKIQIIQKIVNHVKKIITSSKGGESALKFYQDGSFICHLDTIIDNLKVIEEAINTSGFKDDVKIGLVIQADNFYLPDQKKYELENPKKPEDTDQMIEYLFKLCNDKPLIGYLEDPLAEEDIEGWKKLLLKFKDSKVELGSRRLYSTIGKMKQWTDLLDPQKAIFAHRSFCKFSDFRTVSELVSLHKQIMASQKIKWMILSENNFENDDTSIVDFAYAFDNTILCLNPPVKFERMMKYNRFLEIAEYETTSIEK